MVGSDREGPATQVVPCASRYSCCWSLSHPTVPPPDLPHHRQPVCYSLFFREGRLVALHYSWVLIQVRFSCQGSISSHLYRLPVVSLGWLATLSRKKPRGGVGRLLSVGLTHSLTSEHHQSTGHLATPLLQPLSSGPKSARPAWSGGVLVGSAHVAPWARVLQLTLASTL